MATRRTNRPSPSKDAIESLIQQYFLQLTRGCGHKGCSNPNCATGSGKPIDPNKAAATAIALAQQKKKGYLCVSSGGSGPSNMNNLTKNSVSTPTRGSSKLSASQSPGPSSPRQPLESMDTTDSPGGGVDPSSSTDSTSSSTLILVTSGAVLEPEELPHKQTSSSGALEESSSGEAVSMEVSPSPSAKQQVPTPSTPSVLEIPYLTEAKVMELIEKAEKSGRQDYKELTNTLWLVFSNPESLNRSFLLKEEKEKRTEACRESQISVDVGAVRRTYGSLFSLELDSVKNALVNAMDMYCSQLKREKSFTLKQSLNHFVVLLENPLLHSPEFMKAFPKLLQVVTSLPVGRKELLIHWYSHYPTEELHGILSSLQQTVTLQLLFSDDSDHHRVYIPQSDPAITSACGTMTLFFFANLLKAKREGNMKPMNGKLSSIAAKTKPSFMESENSVYEQLLSRLKVHPANTIKAPIPVTEFQNEELNKRVNMGMDYQRYMSGGGLGGESIFSFVEHPFILTAANKVEKLFRDNLVSQFGERQRTLFHAVLTGVPDIPFLMLRVDRNNMVQDTLVQLEAISEMNPIDLRKQLMVEFRGEEGIDEGGLQKELFQLLIEKLFDPMYGMFVYDEDTRQHWFNPVSFESEEQYRLIGLLLGLAIYNNIILDICFPIVVYRKLIGCTTTFHDLYSSHPQIAQGLRSLLEFDGDPQEFEETYMATFQVSFSDVFGTLHMHDLKEGGESIPVTMENRQEYVDLYTDWLLNKSIEKSFDAFKRGFDLVLGQSCLADLFTAEEVELLICGSNEWDLDALEESTHYDGFNVDHPVIINFWQIVRSFPEAQKKQLLAFVTGSDRIPLGGLAKLKFIIVKNGPDSDRLPTAHTCFNALLLCDYSSKEKLQERLTKAISYAKGFGML